MTAGLLKIVQTAIAAAAVSLAFATSGFAQDAAPPAGEAAPATPDAAPPANEAPPPAATQDVKQIKLSEAQVKNFVKAQADLSAISAKLQAAGEKADPELQKELEGIATKHGFSNFTELDDVAANISIVMSGLDQQSGNFTDPVEALQKELDDVKKDESIPEADKKQLVDELTEAIKTTPPVQFKENIELVKSNRADIEKALQ
jgi:hypothetical protein